jgi:hypothetical protein
MAVRQTTGGQGRRSLNGLDYVEVDDDQVTLTVYFLGKLPTNLRKESGELAAHVRIEGGRRIRDISVVQVEPRVVKDPELDDAMIVTVDKPGDFSTYTLRLVGLAGIDPRYDHVDFSFKINCPSDLDCLTTHNCPPPQLDEPEINYLAKDYASFRQLILDRLALIMPDWQERHVPDVGITLVEVLAYAGDYLSYYQDAVASEAYLDTARQRISVRRHARLVDYLLHEGCNARAWVSITTDTDLPALDPGDFYFVTGLNAALTLGKSVFSEDELRDTPSERYEVFEPLVADPQVKLTFRAAHSEIHFYTWGDHACCLPRGATSATLLDTWVYANGSANGRAKGGAQSNPGGPPHGLYWRRALEHLQVGDVLIFEEVIGPKTGLRADADPARRHAVRLTRIQPSEDPLFRQQVQGGGAGHDRPTPVVEIEWSVEDRLPFAFCLSATGPAPACQPLSGVSVARGNVLLVDHGRTVQPAEWLGRVPLLHGEQSCLCEGSASDVRLTAGRFRPQLSKRPLTFRQPLTESSAGQPGQLPAVRLTQQEVRQALPGIHVISVPPALDGTTALFTERDLADPTALIAQLRAPQSDTVRHLRSRFSPAVQARLTEAPPSSELLALVQAELQAMLSDWQPRADLLGSGGDDHHFVVEIDNAGVAHLRFGDDELGQLPSAGAEFYATYRVGNGTRGNVGAGAITHLVLRQLSLTGATVTVRNPLPAVGGSVAEPLAEVKLLAPSTFRQRLERAITAADYATLAERNPLVQRAAATLRWTGSWYAASVAVDPLGGAAANPALPEEVAAALYPYRRIGHDLRVAQAHTVPLDIALTVCVLPGYLRGHVKAALLDLFSNRALTGGNLGFFHPDRLTFGEGVYLSQLVATAQAVTGVESVQVTRLHRLFAAPNHELENGVLPLGPLEIAQLENDPSFPEHGRFTVTLLGGR